MCVSVTFWIHCGEGDGDSVRRSSTRVKLNNPDNLKSIDSTICSLSVIALTPITVNGLLHLKLAGFSRCNLSRLRWKWCKTKTEGKKNP